MSQKVLLAVFVSCLLAGCSGGLTPYAKSTGIKDEKGLDVALNGYMTWFAYFVRLGVLTEPEGWVEFKLEEYRLRWENKSGSVKHAFLERLYREYPEAKNRRRLCRVVVVNPDGDPRDIECKGISLTRGDVASGNGESGTDKPNVSIEPSRGKPPPTLLTSSLPLHAVAQEKLTVRDAALRMMGASVFVPGIAAYCNEHVAANKPLLEAAKDWNVRNKRFMEQVISALRLNGDLSNDQKDRLDRAGYKLAKETINGEPDPILFCTNVTNVVKSGALDLDRREDLAEARTMIRAAPSNSRATEKAANPQQLQAECEEGILRSCARLGTIYFWGWLGEKRDEAKAAFLFGKACNGGDTLGCFEYGMALVAKDVQENDFRAATLFRKACDGEIAISCTTLGFMYDEGRGVLQDQTKAAALYQKACDGGALEGCNSLGSMYSEGRVVPRDPTKAVGLFRKACEGESPRSSGCRNLGLVYAKGDGVKQDYFRAVDLFRKACEGGNAPGCTDLGLAFQAGVGVRQNSADALKYFGKACDLKDEEGCQGYAKLKNAGY